MNNNNGKPWGGRDLISRVAILYYIKCLAFNNNKKFQTCKERGKYGPYTGEKNSQ